MRPAMKPTGRRACRRGEKSGPAALTGQRIVWNATLRRVRAWWCPWAQLQLSWRRWSSAAPPPELAALLAHVARSLPLEGYT
jgi:hypothetical protein